MVSRKRIISATKAFILRFSLLIGVFVLSFFTGNFFHDFNENVFHYVNPSGFFAMASWAEWSLAFDLALVFWSGLIFSYLGKKSDYILIVCIILYAIWGYSHTDNVTPNMYLGLIGVTLLSNAIGYALKLARLKWLSTR